MEIGKYLSQSFIWGTKCLGNSQTIKQRQSVNLRKKTLADAREAKHILPMCIYKEYIFIAKIKPI